MKTRVYLAGAMTGVPNFNRVQFDQAKRVLGTLFDEIVSPVDLCIAEYGEAIFDNPEGCQDKAIKEHGFDRYEQMKINTAALKTCNYIYMMEGWESSEGARIELGFACNNAIHVLKHDYTIEDVIDKMDFWMDHAQPAKSFRFN